MTTKKHGVCDNKPRAHYVSVISVLLLADSIDLRIFVIEAQLESE